jgi:hypothetical protein
MSTSKYLLEQAARCRRLAAHVLDQDMQKRLLDLAEEYERKAAGLPKDGPDVRLSSDGDRVVSARAPCIAEDLENETADP